MNCRSKILIGVYLDLGMSSTNVLPGLIRAHLWEPSSNLGGPEYLTKLLYGLG